MNRTRENTIPMPVRYLINTVLISLLVFGSTAFVNGGGVSGYITKVLMVIGINIILAVSLNVATGYLGQLPLGHAGFMAVGAYTGGIFLKAVNADQATGISYALMVIAALLLSGLLAAVFGVIIGIPALRLRGDYLAIITLGFGEIIRVVLTNIDEVLGFKLTYGASGLKRIPKITSYFNVLVCVVLTCLVIHMVMKSRHGRAILAIRENEIAAESCGVRTTYYKVMAFTLSAFFAGVAGCLYAGYLGSLQPTTFGFMKSIEILVMVVLGGMGSMFGSVLSAITLTALPEALRAFEDYRMVAYSLVLVLVMIFKPTGLMAATLGTAVDELLRRAAAQDLARSVLLDAVASVAAEQAAVLAENAAARALCREGEYHTGRFSPGYGDLPIELQRRIIPLLDAPRQIGLAVTRSLILTPRKSVTALIGVADHLVTGSLAGCDTCLLREKCEWRKRGMPCGGETSN